MSNEVLAAADFYRLAMSPEDRERLPRYRHLLDALALSRVANELLDAAPPEQRNPMLVLAALHFNALLGEPTLTPLYEAISEVEPEVFAQGVVGALERDPTLVSAHLHRRTQTNEPGRSAILGQVLRALALRGPSDVHLIDVGTSMGLNLYPDFYRTNSGDDDDLLNFEVLGLTGPLLDSPLPVIHHRVGIDLNPLDPQKSDDVDWLKACLWPEEPARRRRLETTLEAMTSWPPALRVRGAASDVIDDVIDACLPDATPVVFHSWVASYFSHADQVAWRETMIRHASSRAVWAYFEYPPAVKGLDPPAASTASPRLGGSQIVVAEDARGQASWGWTHPHGRWIALSPPA